MTNLQTATPSPTTLVVRHTYNVLRERLYDAWLDPATMRRFLAPQACSIAGVEVDASVGGRYAIAMNTPEGEMVVRGTYVELRRPERIVFTWSWDEDDPALEHESQVTLEFRARGAQTELVLTHERLRNAESRDRHQNGWTSILGILESAL
ncbi:MAG TPA: SRPBCC domain-containing protein [Verrucomicrobiae bacterium]|nr:SRPBCC domain-containing protein [Verrucomicrobiae bacterium]